MELSKKARSRPWLSLISNESNKMKDDSCKLKVSIRKYCKTKLGEKNNLPGKATIKLEYRIDGFAANVHILEVTSSGVSSEPIKRNRKDIESVYLEEVSSYLACSIDLKVTVSYTDFKPESSRVSYSPSFEWVLQVKNERSSEDGGSLMPSQEVLLFISPEIQSEKSSTMKKEEALEFRMENIGQKPSKNVNAYAMLKLKLAWKKVRSYGKECSLSRRIKSRVTNRKSIFPLTYQFRLSALDDIKLQKYSLQCLWCNFCGATVNGLALHYVINHAEYYIQFFKLDSKVVFDVQLNAEVPIQDDLLQTMQGNSKPVIAEKLFMFKKDQNNARVMKSAFGEPHFLDVNECVDSEGDSEMGSTCDQNEYRHEKTETNDGRVYYFGKTCTNVLNELQQEDDSDEDSTHYEWQSQIAARQISEFVDVNEFEKRFTALWNKHRLSYIDVNGDCQLVILLEAFLSEYKDVLIKENLMSNFVLHLVNIYLNGCLPFEPFQQLLCAAQFLEVTSKVTHTDVEMEEVETESRSEPVTDI